MGFVGRWALSVAFTACMAGAASGASFDCEAPELSADEAAICEKRDLNDADVRMVTTFDLVTGLMAMGSRGAVQDDQVKWLTARRACNGDLECLRGAYASRLKALEDIYKTIERPL